MKKATIMKLLALMLCIMVAISLVACNNDGEETTEAKTENTTESKAETTDKTPESDTESKSESESNSEDTSESNSEDTSESNSEDIDPPACEHTFATAEDGLYTCTKCGFAPTCAGIHTLVNDDPEGHYTAACEHCGAEEGRKNSHTYSADAEYKCTECEFDPECGGVHTYTFDAAGHTTAACDKCGAEEAGPDAHVYTDVIAEGVHVAKCVCGHTVATTVPGSVELYNDALTVINTQVKEYAATMDKNSVHNDTDGSFVRFDKLTFSDTANMGTWGWARLNVVNTTEAITGARYLVFKYRLGDENATINQATKAGYMSIFASSDYMSGKVEVPATDTLNVDIVYDGQWHTVVVDLCRLDIEGATKNNNDAGYDAETQSLPLKLIQMTPMIATTPMNAFTPAKTYDVTAQWTVDATDPSKAVSAWTPESFFDLAYVAVVDDFGDLADVIDQETYTFRVPNRGATNYTFRTQDIGDTAPSEAPLACFGEHVYKDVIVEGKHVAKCVCGDVKATTNVSEAVEVYRGAELVADTTISSHKGNMDVNFVAATDTEVAYTRFDNLTFTDEAKTSDWPWARLNLIHSEEGITNARYVVFQFRTGGKLAGTTAAVNKGQMSPLSMFSSSQYATALDASTLPTKQDSENSQIKKVDGWQTIVVDIARLAVKQGNAYTGGVEYNAETGTAKLSLFQIQPLRASDKQFKDDGTGKAVSAWTEDSYIDIAYVAVVDDFLELKDLIKTDFYQFWGVDGTTNNTLATSGITSSTPPATT